MHEVDRYQRFAVVDEQPNLEHTGDHHDDAVYDRADLRIILDHERKYRSGNADDHHYHRGRQRKCAGLAVALRFDVAGHVDNAQNDQYSAEYADYDARDIVRLPEQHDADDYLEQQQQYNRKIFHECSHFRSLHLAQNAACGRRSGPTQLRQLYLIIRFISTIHLGQFRVM